MGGISPFWGDANLPPKVSRDMGYRSDSIAVSRDMGPLSQCCPYEPVAPFNQLRFSEPGLHGNLAAFHEPEVSPTKLVIDIFGTLGGLVLHPDASPKQSNLFIRHGGPNFVHPQPPPTLEKTLLGVGGV